MELRHLRYFACVAAELNFTRAAVRLRVAQPALSRQIRQLEDELGVALLLRSSRGVQLTEAGRAFLAEARSLLAQSEQAMRVARQGEALRIGYIWGLFHSLVPPLLQQFRRQHPDTAAHLFDLAPMEQARALLDEKLDAGFIGFAHEAGTPGLRRQAVGNCAFVAALPQGHPQSRQTKVSLAKLSGDFFLGISDQTYPGASRHVADAFARAGVRPKYLQMVERGYTILGLVASRCGVALVPESLQSLPHAGVVFRPLTDPPTAELYVAWRAAASSPALRAFLALVPERAPGRLRSAL
ncbi:MAG TPA: LysR substrate-binding domain-containing protein [Verrucomicrobiae bacterium]|jgi:DNA-binding transcriptional LysR family regulator|nr:LysR substrate-binding domain-containing protein [Verrucomicrobiae bacterium]